VAVVLDRDPDSVSGAAAQQYRILDTTDVSGTSGVEELVAIERIGVVVDGHARVTEGGTDTVGCNCFLIDLQPAV
jgi:hypothetical protein